jgi:epoxyqueuosine reductase QueG
MKEPYKVGDALRREVLRAAKKLGAALTGIAPASRWGEHRDAPPQFYPAAIFPFSRTAIVMGVPMLIPMLDATPSIIYSELYNTTNRLLDEIAYKLSVLLNGKGYRAVFFPRDAYGDISVLEQKPEAAFSHVLAAKYAGLGAVGYNHTLLTKEYGPRVRFVSVLTDAEIPPDPMMAEGSLCLQCGMCRKCCPTAAFTTAGSSPIAAMDKHKCARYHRQLREQHRYPCGVCIKVCPVGNDRKLYGASTQKYLNEQKILNENPQAPEYAAWTHLRSFGST